MRNIILSNFWYIQGRYLEYDLVKLMSKPIHIFTRLKKMSNFETIKAINIVSQQKLYHRYCYTIKGHILIFSKRSIFTGNKKYVSFSFFILAFAFNNIYLYCMSLSANFFRRQSRMDPSNFHQMQSFQLCESSSCTDLPGLDLGHKNFKF